MAQGERETLLALQQALTDEQFQSLKFLLEGQVPLGLLAPATRPELCRLLLQRFPGRALRVASDLLRQLGRHDLLRKHRLPGAEAENAVGSSENGDADGFSENGCSESEDARRVAPARVVETPPAPPRRLSEKELMQVAQRLGREWQEVGIACLGLERNRLDQIREDNPRSMVLQSFEMLREWRRRHGDEATASRLRACLAPASLDPELLDLLQSFQKD
ncbi:CRADD protein, partial [Piaya cayana]|nr:CRADD protein [Piaya cayana]